MRITKTKKKLGAYLRQYHPNKYHMLIRINQEENQEEFMDMEIKVFPMPSYDEVD